ncbi:hypothetical protein PENTCL1PPCAC_30102 [Pristionchus entomophagus]|uniref:guanylate cyclase n=1 Tax=Pristionchus entomophagus TaxID=358040 RepID=A0AAV5UP45_9BILA|nr:hypothetical protein PENTCL1PPCAC_30102 [Pristionchus entomophagus]
MRVLIFLLLFGAQTTAAETDIKVSLVTDSAAYPKAENVLKIAISDSRINGRLFNLVPTTTSAGCPSSGIQGAGAFAVVDGYKRKNISAVFGPTCFMDLKISSRITFEWNIMQFNFWDDHPSDTLDNTVVQMATRSTVNVAANLIAALTAMGWDKIVIFACPTCYGDQSQGELRINYIVRYLASNGITILTQRTFLATDTPVDITRQLNDTRTRGRIFLPLGGPDTSKYASFMQAVKMADLPHYDYAVVLVINSYNVNGLSMPWKTTPDLLSYYNHTIIIYNDAYSSSAARAFASKINVNTENADELVLYMTLYESVFFYSNLIEARKFVQDSRGLLNYVRKQLFSGPFGNYTLNEVTNRITPYRVVYIRPSGDPLELATINLRNAQCLDDSAKQCVSLDARLLDTSNYSLELPLDMPVCGFEGELCEQTSTILVIIGIVAGLAILSILFFVYRRLKGNEIRDMPWSLPVDQIQFINTNREEGAERSHPDNSFQSLQLLQELAPPPTASGSRDASGALKAERSRRMIIPLPQKSRLANIVNNFSCVFTYPFIEKRSNFNRDEIQLFYQMKQCVHDNVNTFLGISYDSPEMFVCWQQCFKGTLTDVLREAAADQTQYEAKKMNNNIRGAFVRDILKGLEFLHLSGVKFHGALNPNNCVVDSHWVLKLSGFGINRLLNRWRHKRTITTFDKSTFIPNSELHYYAPEIRKLWKDVHQSGRNDMEAIDPDVGKKADVFSFGMVLYEILYKEKFVTIPDDYGVPVEDEFNVGDAPNYLFHYEAEEKASFDLRS